MRDNRNPVQQFFNSRLGICRHCGHAFLLPPRTGGLFRSKYSSPCPRCKKPVNVKL